MTSKNKTILSIALIIIFCVSYTFILPKQFVKNIEKYNNGILFETIFYGKNGDGWDIKVVSKIKNEKVFEKLFYDKSTNYEHLNTKQILENGKIKCQYWYKNNVETSKICNEFGHKIKTITYKKTINKLDFKIIEDYRNNKLVSKRFFNETDGFQDLKKQENYKNGITECIHLTPEKTFSTKGKCF
ncbi:MAG: hypothetical protein ACTSXL_05940 [Alphaproteobacteria bacterium]